MFIKSMIIDGFKSYGRRTEITGFDSEFNAITGMNGSGKSNILDAICFLLGISNLSQVRATDLRDLVFKSGQGGITKATVTIIFDNRDKSRSPIGYDMYDEITVTRQIVVGGKNKYMINGTTAQNQKVTDLFRSIQLNVNNPHFLIMQGRVTKVLNMKPVEILGMIEEAAGTKMYESKKISTLKVMEKKNAKLAEIDSIISETITPTIEKCKKEKQQYVKLQQITRDLEHSKKTITAFKYYSAEKKIDQLKTDLKNMESKVLSFENDIAEGGKECSDLDLHIKELEELKEKEIGHKISKLEEVLKEKTKDEVDASAYLKSLKEDLKVEKGNLIKAEKSLSRDQKALETKLGHAAKYEDLFNELEKNAEMSEAAVVAAQRKLRDVENDVVTTDSGEESSLLQLLYTKKGELTEATRKISDIKNSLNVNSKDLKVKQAELVECEATHRDGLGKLKELKKNLGRLENDMAKSNYVEGSYEELENQLRMIRGQIRDVCHKISQIELRNPNAAFSYDPPDPGFDQSAVKGVVCRLFKVKDVKYATALELVAGSKLYEVVVDNDAVSKLLINKGNLQRRVTMIPLNRIQSRTLPERIVKLAERKVGRDKVFTALSLIEFDPIFKPAMEYVFGEHFICTDIEVAKLVTFDEAIHQKCVTIDGEVLNPVGTLSGGFRGNRTPVLTQMSALIDLCSERSKLEFEFNNTENKINEITKIAKRYNAVKEEAESKSREIQLYENMMADSQYQTLKGEIESIQKFIETNRADIEKYSIVVEVAPKEIEELEYKMKNKDSLKKEAVESAKKELEKCKNKAKVAKDKWKEKEHEANIMKMEIETLENSVETEKAANEVTRKKIDDIQLSIDSKESELQKFKKYVEEAESRVKQEKEKLMTQNKEINDLISKKHSKQQMINDKGIEVSELSYAMKTCKGEIKHSEQTIDNLIRSHNWIASEKQFFGVANSNFDFSTVDLRDLSEKIKELENNKSALSKNVNTRAMNVLAEAERQYNDLMRRKDIVISDKKKIETFIREIDDKKKNLLASACEQVNKDFGSIFSTLLPGAMAKLESLDGKEALEGLEIKVGFGKTWKESLNELSGGQRSLVALSLILAMLLFKPAPLYILDEVDAALDLSHTQNIGSMLKKHFKHSQFIVVSLKDGMFNNANVLFRTKFVDGASTVSRTNNVR